MEELIKIDEYPIKDVLDILLKDWTTGKNIIWATDSYLDQGEEYSDRFEIQKFSITGQKSVLIQPRVFKASEAQQARTKVKAEVFTPSWIVNKMNNALDENWFNKDGVFNTETDNDWIVNHKPLPLKKKKDFEAYVGQKVLEITCGEAPFIVSRYDAVSGELIPIDERIGVLDRKLRAVNEKTKDDDWLKYIRKAFKSVYGYEYQGDNLLITRINLLLTFVDYYRDRFDQDPDQKLLKEFAKIISKNLWQMDGLTQTVPLGMPKPLHQQLSLFDIEENEKEAPLCKIVKWEKVEISFPFKLLNEEKPMLFHKGKEINVPKFDVVIGNPPYQEEDGGGGAGKSASPVYNKFVEAIKQMNPEVFSLVIPSRWFNGGKGLDSFRQEMLNDERISKIVDFADSKECFPGVDIPGGVCYLVWKKDHSGPTNVVFKDVGQPYLPRTRKLNEFPTFIRNNLSVDIVHKVKNKSSKMMNEVVSSRKPFGLESNQRSDDSGEILLRSSKGLGSISRDKIKVGLELIDKWKVIVSKVTVEHAGVPNKDGTMKVLSIVQTLPPNSASTETYLIAGTFDNEISAKRLERYLKTKFVRFLISQMLASMNMSKASYSFVPIQNFSDLSDINWDLPIDEIDHQLFKKYDLTKSEIEFIESKIRRME